MRRRRLFCAGCCRELLDNEAGIQPSPEQLAAIGEQMQEIAMTGVLLGGEGVHAAAHRDTDLGTDPVARAVRGSTVARAALGDHAVSGSAPVLRHQRCAGHGRVGLSG